MARPSKTAPVDYKGTNDLTHGLLERAACPDGLPFVLVRDADKKGLRLRVTKAKGKHWQFETRIKGKLFTRALGEWPTVSIDQAKTEAHRLRGLTEQGIDPREGERQQEAAKAAAFEAATAEQNRKAQQEAAQALTVGEVWQTYIEARRARWGALHLTDHIRLSAAGGVKRKRGDGLTIPGPLHSLMAGRLIDLSASKVTAWAEHEALTRPTPARLSWRLLRAFLTWCAEQPEYAPLVAGTNAAKTKKTREALGKAGKKRDALLREQLPAWFAAVRQIGNPTIAAYLQIMLLTGARPNEILTMRWDGVNTKWQGLTIRDKIDRVTRERTIPLTPYVAHLLATLPKRNEWVFSSTTSASGHLTVPTHPHNRACKVAGIDGLSLHGLRRSFKSLSEWLDIPHGVRQNIMGHVAKSTDEDYTIRPLDLLRVHHEKIEAWALEQAGVAFDAKTEPGKLRVVAG
jgi:integrase